MIKKVLNWFGGIPNLKYYALGALALIAVASSTLLYISYQQNKIDNLENVTEQQKKQIQDLESQVLIQNGSIESLNSVLKTQRDLVEAARREAELRQTELSQLLEKYDVLKRDLPKPLTRQQEAAQTPKQEEHSRQRILTLWKAYCEAGNLSPVCEEMKP